MPYDGTLQGRKPRILTWDIECTDLEITKRQYGLKNYISYDNPKNITRDWTFLGAATKFVGEQPQCISVSPKDPLNDYEVIAWLHDKLSQADMIVGHNSKRFDWKKFRARAIVHGFDALNFKGHLNYDTLTVAKREFNFTSNKLSYLADYLGIDAKDNAPDWYACIEGCPEALRYMRKYNKQDVIVGEKIYQKVAPYDPYHPDLSTIANIKYPNGDKVLACKACASVNLKNTGHELGRGKRTFGYFKKRYKCLDCGVQRMGDNWHKQLV